MNANFRAALHRWLGEGHGWQGLQLAASVALSFLASGLLGLPQGFWAVMSALIVMRANPDATLDAGRDRVLGTVAGALAGVAGIALFGDRGHAPAASLAIVCTLTFLTAVRPSLRSAPISALIVLAATGSATQGPLHAALLRTAEIATGVITALAVAWLSRHLGTTARPSAACARLLRQLEQQVRLPTDATPEAREAQARTVRATARRIGELVQGSRTQRERQMLQLALRLSQDVALLLRVRAARAADQSEPDAALVQAAAAALLACARRLEGAEDAHHREALRELAASPVAGWSADPTGLLREDLQQLLRVAHAVEAKA
jgi:uncharacterized membrane protein YccC